MKSNSHSIRRKIQKALALSSNNPSKEEAQTALLLAQKLMLENDLTIEDFEENRSEKEIIEVFCPYKKLYWYEKKLAHVIAENFRCYRFWRGTGNKNKLIFFGLKRDAYVAKDVYNYAVSYMNSSCDKYIKENNLTHNRAARNEYRLGFIDGLSRKLREQVQEYGLILVKDPELVEDHEEKRKSFRIIADSSPETISDPSNYYQGQIDGESFDHNRKQLEREKNYEKTQ